MKIKVKTTFRRAFSLLLCMVMLFGIAPFSGMVANAATMTYTITCYESSEKDIILWQENYAAGATLVVPANVTNPTREGHTFKYWSEPIPATMPAHDISTTAQWDVNQYTIKFISDGYPNSIYKTITQDYGTPITAPANPARDGYIFAGWDQPIPANMPARDYDIEIRAKWILAKTAIVFDSNGGSYVAPIEKDFGELITPPADPTREGYTFLGWNPAIPTSMPAQGMTLTAQWQINKYTITFTNYYDTYIPPITQDFNTVIVKPEAPKRDGYTFAGWSEAIPERMPSRDMTIEAQWIPNVVDISYDPNGGYVEDPDTDTLTDAAITIPYTFGKPFAAPENSVINPDTPIRAGYTFLGWYDAAGNIRPTDVPSVPTTYYAKWIEGTGNYFYKVTTYRMDENGNYQLASENLFSGAEGDFVYAEVNTTSGFSIDGAKSTLTGSLANTNGIDNPLQLSVYLKRNTYTITFNVAGGTAIAPITALYGSVVNVPANPTKAGYTFDGWMNDGTGKPDTIPTIMPAADTSFTAQWIANGNTPYKVVVSYKDVTDNDTVKTKEYNFYGTTGRKVKVSLTNSAATEPGAINHNVSEFFIEHYKVDTSAASIANQVLEANIAADGSTVLKLEYIPVNYTVTFTVAGKACCKPQAVQYFKHANTVEPTKAYMDNYFATEMPGYTFKGWEPKLDKVTGDIEYKALYNSIPYTVSFNYVKVVKENGVEFTTSLTPDAGQELASITQGYNTSFSVPGYPVKTGYTCLGWFSGNTQYFPGQPVVMPKEGLILTAKYTANTYYISFNSNLDGASYVTPIAAPCDDEVTIPAYPVKEGCKCVGWYAADGTRYEAGAKVTMPAGGMTLTAQWDIGKFNIIYRDGDKDLSAFTKKDISCGDKITAPNYPTAADPQGRTFVGWREKGKTNLFTHNEMPGYSLVLEAVWGYTVTFVDDNNAIIKKVALEPGAKIVAPAIPDRIGTVVVGWVDLPETMPAKNIVIKAARVYNQYTVTYKVDGEVYAQQKCQYGQTIQEIEAPRKWFKKFVGWKDLPETMPAYDIEVNAEWTDSDFVKGIRSFFDGIVKFLNIILGFIS